MAQLNKLRGYLTWSALLLFIAAGPAVAEQAVADSQQKPTISLSEDIGQTVIREASKVKEELRQQTRSMFQREPLGWDRNTIGHLYQVLIGLPGKIPSLFEAIQNQARLLGAAGSGLMLLFLLTILYSLLGRRRVLKWAEAKAQPLKSRVPDTAYPYFHSALRVVVSALVPIVLLSLYALMHAMTRHKTAWFELTGRLLGLWAASSIVLCLLKEVLTQGPFAAKIQYGKTLLRWTRVTLVYAAAVIAIFWTTEALRIRQDGLALIRFIVSVSIVLVLFRLFLKKKPCCRFSRHCPTTATRALSGFSPPITTR